MFSVIVRLHFASLTLLEQNANAMELIAWAVSVCGIGSRSTPRWFRGRWIVKCNLLATDTRELFSPTGAARCKAPFSRNSEQHHGKPMTDGFDCSESHYWSKLLENAVIDSTEVLRIPYRYAEGARMRTAQNARTSWQISQLSDAGLGYSSGRIDAVH
jgi:hypothetical protein